MLVKPTPLSKRFFLRASKGLQRGRSGGFKRGASKGTERILLLEVVNSFRPLFGPTRSKKGFGIPVVRWLRGPLAPLVARLFDRDRLRRQGLFRPEEVARRVAEHQAGARDHRKPLWTLLMFQLWYDRWLG